MPTNLTEERKDGHGLASESNGTRSREIVTLESGQNLKPGAVLGQVTGTSEYKEYNPGNGDGSEAAVAVLFSRGDASAAAVKVVAVVRDAEYDADALAWFSGASAGQIDTGVADLLANSEIVVRPTSETALLVDQG
jgi:hypothetical protein